MSNQAAHAILDALGAGPYLLGEKFSGADILITNVPDVVLAAVARP